MNNNIKTKRLNIRVSKEEYEILQKKAKQPQYRLFKNLKFFLHPVLI